MTDRHTCLAPSAICPAEKSRELAEHYQAVADDLGIHYLDASKMVVKTDLHGVHWDANQHQAFGEALSGTIGQII